MCGVTLVGGNLNSTDLKVFKQLTIADYFRGPHSVGIASCRKGYYPLVHKSLDLPAHFFDRRLVDNALNTSVDVLIGHNRHATLGGVTYNNAHPFTHGEITMVHNGTLTNKAELERKYNEDQGDFDTDSELVCYMLSKYPVKQVLKALEGAFTLIWYDGKDEKLNVVRNDERPFNYVITSTNIYGASEGEMLDWILKRNKVYLSSKSKISSLPVGKLLTVDCSDKTVKAGMQEVSLAPKYSRNWIGKSTSVGTGGTYRSGTYRSVRAAAEAQGLRMNEQDPVYAYFDRIVPQSSGRPCVVFNTAVGFIPVKCWWFDESLLPEKPEDYIYTLNLSSVSHFLSGHEPIFNGVVKTVKVLDINDEAVQGRLQKWIDATLIQTEGTSTDEIIDLEDVQEAPFDDVGMMDDFQFAIEDSEPLKIKTVQVRPGEYATESKFRDYLQQGCFCCGNPIDSDAELIDRTVVFTESHKPVCSSCQEEPEILEMLSLSTDDIKKQLPLKTDRTNETTQEVQDVRH